MLRRGPGRSAAWLAAALRVLPSGWGPVAVEAAARGEWLAATGWLAGLAALTVAVAACWPVVLSRRMDAAARPARAGGGHRAVRVAVTIAFTALSGDNAAWPWVLAVLPALLGGAAGWLRSRR